jgi:hypothetical protein
MLPGPRLECYEFREASNRRGRFEDSFDGVRLGRT